MNNNLLNLIAAIVISLSIMLGWQHFYEKPRQLQQLAQQRAQIVNASKPKATISTTNDNEAYNNIKDNNITADNITIKTDSLEGSISLKGLRFDNLTLLKYKENLHQDSQAVTLLKPIGDPASYFAEIGWVTKDSDLDLPTANTIWQSQGLILTPSSPVVLGWVNKHGIKFIVNIAIDGDYLFTIKQEVINNSEKEISIQPYGIVNRSYSSNEKLVNILHQGAIGVINSELTENSYDDIKDKKNQKFINKSVDWVGITDKYWLVAFIPDKNKIYNTNFNYIGTAGVDKYQVDYIAPYINIAPGAEVSVVSRFFAGAKKVDLLDKYAKEFNIKLFDRAIDFGWFYILTKPVFNALNYFYKYTKNFGVSILIVTVIIKLLMFTLASKSYKSMKRIKTLQPEIDRIKSLYANDKAKLNQEIMQLYKRERVNPVSGCLPLLVQIPVFFSIYKVLYVTIEMRHAPFFGWIKDLSAPDPTNIFNLFGLLPYTPPSFLMIGVWPILMAFTMMLQQRMSPPPSDPVQEQVMKFMPLFFLVMFSSFPAGLLIYWSWNNILSIIQQIYINKISKD